MASRVNSEDARQFVCIVIIPSPVRWRHANRF